MAVTGTSIPNDAGAYETLPSVPNPEQADINNRTATNLAGAADNATDMPKSSKDIGATGEVMTATGDQLPAQNPFHVVYSFIQRLLQLLQNSDNKSPYSISSSQSFSTNSPYHISNDSRTPSTSSTPCTSSSTPAQLANFESQARRIQASDQVYNAAYTRAYTSSGSKLTRPYLID
ncbi:hypothetical protein JADG_009785 [Aureobasidium aubasidani]|nr:hypothetical protein JADG_009784 [Aureobasidium pullulans]KAG2170046.1 hypothetical protein JADG_009785 [Aureobasidium pullulans]